jgi:hypothetical protein
MTTSEEKAVYTTHEGEVRELDRRTSDGIVVTLLWNANSGRVSVAVEDTRNGDSFEFEVEATEAVAAFYHPYSYASGDHRDRQLAA